MHLGVMKKKSIKIFYSNYYFSNQGKINLKKDLEIENISSRPIINFTT